METAGSDIMTSEVTSPRVGKIEKRTHDFGPGSLLSFNFLYSIYSFQNTETHQRTMVTSPESIVATKHSRGCYSTGKKRCAP